MRNSNFIKKKASNAAHTWGTWAAMVAIVVLAACTDDTLDTGVQAARRDDGKSIIVEVSGGAPDADTRTQYDLASWHTEFAEGDQIGVFCYRGSRAIASNVKFTFDGESWTGETGIPYREDYTYFAYYPYAGSNGNPPYAVGTSGTADERFASYITDSSNKFHYAVQNTMEYFAKSDYMHAQGVDDGLRTITFTMQHKKALAVLGSTVNKWYDTSDPLTPHGVYVNYTDNFPLEVGEYKYFLCKPGVATTIGGTTFTGQGGKYNIKDASAITGTPTLTYAVSTNGGNSFGGFSATAPEWLTVTPDVTAGEPTDFDVTMVTSKTTNISKGQAEQRTVPGDALLKAATPVTDVDLSMYENDGTYRGTRTTANCYLVHAPGTYRIPLVYGNAIKDGNENSSSYYTPIVHTRILSRLVNHKDEGITTPWIKDNGINVDGAELMWEDVKNVIKNVGIEGDYLTFEVDADNIAEGNAVIAVSSAAEEARVWSWHIWITPETLEETTTINPQGTVYEVAPVNVGQVSGNVSFGTIYQGSQCKVRATGTGGTIEFLVTQPDYMKISNSYDNPNTYYQWGRKDPIWSAIGASRNGRNLSLVVVTTNQYDEDEEEGIPISIGSTIKHPSYCFYSENSGPYGTYDNKFNLWDIKNVNYGEGSGQSYTTKTVYDPCPPGFCVPSRILYDNMNNYNYYNPGSYIFDGNYFTWILDTPNIVWTKTGCRIGNTGSLYNYGIPNTTQEGRYHTASIGNSAGTNCLSVLFNSKMERNQTSKSTMMSVRAVREN